MVTVKKENNKITIAGHACYAEKGKDIVCAAVSILAYTLEASVSKLTHDTADFVFLPDITTIEFKTMSETSKILLNSFIIGIEELAVSYPDHVELIN